jgi:6-pyruvoyltetrahydropterin/6-carboxytetrahydropterin synthase
MITAQRYHDISCGHRVYGHESKCAHLHGHNYRVNFVCAAPDLDVVGRVIDFSVIKSRLCMWLEEEWDHKFLVWQEDPWSNDLALLDPTVVVLPFNPTAEKMADFLLRIIGPQRLEGTGVELIKVDVEETRKCSASASGLPNMVIEELAKRRVAAAKGG